MVLQIIPHRSDHLCLDEDCLVSVERSVILLCLRQVFFKCVLLWRRCSVAEVIVK